MAARRLRVPPAAPWVWRAPPYAIGNIAAFRLVERLATFQETERPKH